MLHWQLHPVHFCEMQGVRFEESPFGYWYNTLADDWQTQVRTLQQECGGDVYVNRRQTATGEFIVEYTPCDRSYRPPGWVPLKR
jgi:hypothetical protein